jgi:hypothetical protein
VKCVYHPQNEAAGICTSCSKSICYKCLEQVGGKNYCGDCASALFGEHDALAVQQTSLWWYLLPVLLGIVGGVIGYLFLRKIDPKRAADLLLTGLIFNAIWLTIAIYNISI